MNAAQTMTMTSTQRLGGINVTQIKLEMDQYRQETNWLRQVNDLHSLLARTSDMTAMAEAFAAWLEPLVPHDLIGILDRGRSRAHLMSALHGPARRRALAITHEIMVRGQRIERPVRFMAAGFHVALWQLEIDDDSNYLVVLRRSGTITDDEARIVEQAKLVLEGPLRRALNYENIYEEARRDPLTGLANRRVLDEQIDALLDSAARHGRPITLAALDLDRFKAINDNLGHAAGDQALRRVASAIERLIRKCDLLVRVGGDEFLLVLPDTCVESARVLAERITRAVHNMCIETEDGVRLGVSIGLAQWRRGHTQDEWAQQADEALYQAKKEGHHRVCLSEMR